MKLTVRTTLLTACSLSFLLSTAWADVGGKIAGVVKDQTDAVVPGAMVVAVNTATGVKQRTKTDDQGSYAFPVLPVGQYQIEVTADGFKPNKTGDLAIDINTALTVDLKLQLSDQNQTVVVTEGGVQVETSDTQLGQVIESKQVTSLPLNGRTYTDLFATQVGVTPLTTSGAGNSTSGGGFGTVPVAPHASHGIAEELL